MRISKLRFLLPAVLIILLTACSEVATENFLERSDIVISDHKVPGDSGETDSSYDLPYEDWFTRLSNWGGLALEDDWHRVDFVLTPKTALEIGDAILRHTFGAENLSDTPATIVENDEENIFIIERMTNSGESINVTLDKTDARIVRIHQEREFVDVTITPRMALEIGDAALRLVFSESIFEDSVFRVVEVIDEDAFYVWRIPRTAYGADGEFPLAVINGKNGRIIQVGHN